VNPILQVALLTALAMGADTSPMPRRFVPPPPPEPDPEPESVKPAPLPPPDPEAQARALAIPPVTTRAQRRERAWLARVRESERSGGES